ncbi:MAG: enoyl-CoA hydratase/isomerase family protein [Alphaproteobacteria bacterium]|nr:enoyl-CoA hydratase/isomerase family protein [Alphaproteobacteria bacterium]
MAEATVIVQTDLSGLAVVTMNRPEVHNALDDHMVARLTKLLREVAADEDVRTVALAASGRSFSAGADLEAMRRAASAPAAENLERAMALAELLRLLDTLPQPTIGCVQGPCYGGGVGLLACCDVVVAARRARFQLTEVRLGLIPAVISPYVVRALGVRQARRFFLTGEAISAEEAQRFGLVHELVAEPGDLHAARARFAQMLKLGAPGAVTEAKRLIADVANRPIDPDLIAETARRIAERRTTAEGIEGVEAFLAKRRPSWCE